MGLYYYYSVYMVSGAQKWLEQGHTVPHRQFWENRVHSKKNLGEVLVMNFWSSNALLKLKNNALFTRWNLFSDFFMCNFELKLPYLRYF